MKKYWKIIITLSIITVFINILACFKGFCNWYSDGIYNTFCTVISLITGIFPFAIGEIVMYIFGLSIIALAILSLLFIFLRKKDKFKKFYIYYSKSCLMAFVIALLSYSFMWIIPFRSSLLGKGEEAVYKEFDVNDLLIVRNHLVNKANYYSKVVGRDSDGHIVYPDNVDSEVTCALGNLSDRYPRLRGYSPKMKKALCSDFLDWMEVGGFTYPFSKEVLYNKYVDSMWYMALYAHELSHHHGYFQENEATYLSTIALIESNNSLLNYEGYIVAYSYINNALAVFLYYCPEDDPIWEEYRSSEPLSKQISIDLDYAKSEAKERYAKDAHPAQGMSNYVKEISKSAWDAQYAVLKKNTYEGVVPLLMRYYIDLFK